MPITTAPEQTSAWAIYAMGCRLRLTELGCEIIIQLPETNHIRPRQHHSQPNLFR